MNEILNPSDFMEAEKLLFKKWVIFFALILICSVLFTFAALEWKKVDALSKGVNEFSIKCAVEWRDRRACEYMLRQYGGEYNVPETK